MPHVRRELLEFRARPGILRRQQLREPLEIARQPPSLRIDGEEGAEIVLVLREQRRGLAEPVHLRCAQSIQRERRRDVHAVEDVADIVQHPGRDLRHAGPARRVAQLPVQFREPRLGGLGLGDVHHHAVEGVLLPIRRRDEDRLIAEPAQVAGAVEHPVFGEEVSRAHRDRLGVDGDRAVVGMDLLEPKPVGGQPLGRRKAEQRLDLRAHVGPGAGLAARRVVGDRGKLHDEAAVAHFALAQLRGALLDGPLDDLLRRLQLLRHAVETRGEFAHFVGAVDDQRVVEFSRGDVFRRAHQPAERLHHPARKEGREQPREERADERAEQQVQHPLARLGAKMVDVPVGLHDAHDGADDVEDRRGGGNPETFRIFVEPRGRGAAGERFEVMRERAVAIPSEKLAGLVAIGHHHEFEFVRRREIRRGPQRVDGAALAHESVGGLHLEQHLALVLEFIGARERALRIDADEAVQVAVDLRRDGVDDREQFRGETHGEILAGVKIRDEGGDARRDDHHRDGKAGEARREAHAPPVGARFRGCGHVVRWAGTAAWAWWMVQSRSRSNARARPSVPAGRRKCHPRFRHPARVHPSFRWNSGGCARSSLHLRLISNVPLGRQAVAPRF